MIKYISKNNTTNKNWQLYWLVGKKCSIGNNQNTTTVIRVNQIEIGVGDFE